MNKQTAKALIKFVERNAAEILREAIETQDEMMACPLSCVLRPRSIPRKTRNKMTDKEFNKYERRAWTFHKHEHINKAVLWVREWVKK